MKVRGKKRKKKDKSKSSDEEEISSIAERSKVEYKVFVKLVREGSTFEDWNPIQLTKAIHKEFGEVRS